MRIIYDGTIYLMQQTGGINRYFANLIGLLPESYEPTLVVSEQRQFNYPSHPRLRVMDKRFQFRPRRISNWMQNAYFRSVSNPRHYDIAHPTYYSVLTKQELKHYAKPLVITVYDMIHEIFAQTVDLNGAVAREKRAAVMAADAVLCISESTKRDLLERYPISEDRIKVTYLASEIDISLSYGSEAVPERPYFLYVGSRASYKNFDRLLSVFAHIALIQSDVILCVVGLPFTLEEERLLNDLRLTDRVINYGLIEDNHLAKLYRCSLAFVYPSLYEGFGIPPLEAMSCGTVVIAAATSSLPEVIGDAGILFDPYSEVALADAMLSILNSPSYRSVLISKGTIKAKDFSWDKTIAQTLAVYKALSN